MYPPPRCHCVWLWGKGRKSGENPFHLPQVDVSDAFSTEPFGTVWRGLERKLGPFGAPSIMRLLSGAECKLSWCSAQAQRIIFLTRLAGGGGGRGSRSTRPGGNAVAMGLKFHELSWAPTRRSTRVPGLPRCTEGSEGSASHMTCAALARSSWLSARKICRSREGSWRWRSTKKAWP